MKDCLIVIPARFSSKRLPGKVLANIGGKTILQRVYENCKKTKAAKVIIATDSKKVLSECQKFQADAVMTNAECKSGTDRVWSVAKKYPYKFIINAQADMPFISSKLINEIYRRLKSKLKADIVTAGYEISSVSEIKDPNNVKIVMTKAGRALYFSRTAVPHSTGGHTFWKHYGIYGFKKESLKKFVNLKQSPLEKRERLEQLRAIEAGMGIYCVKTVYQGPTVDTETDLKEARKYLKK